MFVDLTQPINNDQSVKIEIKDNKKKKTNLISFGTNTPTLNKIKMIFLEFGNSLLAFVKKNNDIRNNEMDDPQYIVAGTLKQHLRVKSQLLLLLSNQA